MKIYTVEEWGGKRINNGDLGQKPAAGIVVHHTTSPNRKAFPEDLQFEEDKAFHLARAIQKDHMSTRNGTKPAWRDTGNHFLVTRGGLVLEGRNGTLDAARRGMVIYGAHSGNTTANGNRWGIECEGNTEDAPLTDVQWEALVALCAQLSIWGGTQAANILGHRQVHSTICPGAWLFGQLERLQKEARTRKLLILGIAG